MNEERLIGPAGSLEPTRRPRVLVVDDEPGYRAMLEWELVSRGMDVRSACDGREAAVLSGYVKFDVIVTDLTMPQGDGLALLDYIKQSVPQTEVIMATGFGTVEVAVHALQKGAFHFMLKPYDLEALVTCIKDAVERLPVRSCDCKRQHSPLSKSHAA